MKFPFKFPKSMTILSPTKVVATDEPKPMMAHLETLEAKMASIEVSLSSNTPRRRKGTSLGGGSSISARASPRPSEVMPSKEHRSALQDREAVIQSLRVQLGLGKLPRPTGTPLDESEKPAAEQRLNRLRVDVDNKRTVIRNLKAALDKLDITDNIDVRIRQAELEYALGREELQLLSLVEESRALQSRLDKSKPENNTLYSTIRSGVNLSIQAVQATIGRWAACTKPDSSGLWVEWALDGEGLYRGDRIIEVNGKIITCKTKEELQKLIGVSGKCQLVIVRKRSTSFQQQQLLQSQEDNQRLQHRISYLEDHVKELQNTCETTKITDKTNGSHVTSISISSPPTTPPDKPQIYQRGNFVTTIIGGKAVNSSSNGSSPSSLRNHITKTIIKENQQNGCRSDGEGQHLSKAISASKISINSDITYAKRERERQREREQRKEEQRDHQHQHQHQHNHYQHNHHYNQRNQQRSNSRSSTNRYSEGGLNNYQHSHAYAKSVEHLNYNMNGRSSLEKRKEPIGGGGGTNGYGNHHEQQTARVRVPMTTSSNGTDMRSVKSLDFESDTGERKQREINYTSEPEAQHRIRPTPPKKPLRLSLQRAQSLQTVEAAITENEKKRAAKRPHKAKLAADMQYIENTVPLQTASLGRTHI